MREPRRRGEEKNGGGGLTDELLLWLDVETTGLDPDQDCLLEVAAICTTFDPSFEPVGAEFHVVIKTPQLYVGQIDPKVLEMHVKNGLWEECSDSGLTEREAGEALRRWVINTVPFQTKVWAAGRSVHFDLAWVELHLPVAWQTLEDRLHHRRFDLTPIKAYATMCDIGFGDVSDDAHRALTDVRADIELARRLVVNGSRW